jgi:hypothetical protein
MTLTRTGCVRCDRSRMRFNLQADLYTMRATILAPGGRGNNLVPAQLFFLILS